MGLTGDRAAVCCIAMAAGLLLSTAGCGQDSAGWTLVPPEGGTVRTPDGRFALEFAADPLRSSLRVRIQPGAAPAAGGDLFQVSAVDAVTGRLIQKVVVPVHVTARDMVLETREGIPGEKLRLFSHAAGRWQPQGGEVDRLAGAVSAWTHHLTRFKVMATVEPTNDCTVPTRIHPGLPFTQRPPGFIHETTTPYEYIFGTRVWLSGSAALSPILTHDRSTITGAALSPPGQPWIRTFRFVEDVPQPPFELTGSFDSGGDTDLLLRVPYSMRVRLENIQAQRSGSWPYWLVARDVGKPNIQSLNVWQDGEGSIYVEATAKDNCSTQLAVTLSGTNSESPDTTRTADMIFLGDDLYGGVLEDLGKTGLYTLVVSATDEAGNTGSRQIEVEASYSGAFGFNYFSSSCPPGNVGECGDPVNTASGSFTHHTTDLRLPGAGDTDLDVTRAYNSKSAEVGPFGRGWTFPFGFRLELVDNLLLRGVKAHLPDGRTLLFQHEGGGRYTTLTPGAEDVLSFSGGEFELRQKRLTTYRFDVAGRLTAVVDPTGNTKSLQYEGGLVARVENSSGRWLALRYSGGRVSEISGPEGALLKYGYDGGLLSSFTDLRGRTWRYEYDGEGRLSAILSPRGHPTLRLRYSEHGRVVEQIEGKAALHTFAYDDPGRLRTLTDAASRVTLHHYDQQSRLVKMTDALGFEESYGYDDEGRRTSFIDKAGSAWHYTYDDRGNLLREEGPLGWKREREYNALDKVVLERDARGREKRFEYDVRGNLIAQIDPAGGRTEISYDERGLPLQIVDPAGHRTTNVYDAAGNLVEKTDAAGGVTRHAFDGLARETQTTMPNGAVFSNEYDEASPLRVRTLGPLGLVLAWEQDDDGALIRRIDGNGGVWQYAYDASGRLIEEANPLGAVTRYTFGPMGEMLSRTDAEGRVTSYEYDARLQESAVHAPENATTRKVRDAKGNVSAEIDPEGRETSWKRDALDRVVEQVQNERPAEPESADTNVRTRYSYDLAGNVLRIESPRGVVTEASYDLLDRRVEEIRNRRPNQPSDASTNVITRFDYDAVGNVVRRTDPRGNATVLEYDGRRRVVLRRDALGRTTTFEYDSSGNLTRKVSPTGRVTRYAYDALDRRTETVENHDPGHGPDGDTNVTVRFAYDLNGNPTSRIDGRGFTTRYQYDAANRLVKVVDPSGAATRYAYDKVGNRTAEINGRGAPVLTAYDGLNRTVRIEDAEGHAVRMAYDRVGNVTAATDARGNTTHHEYDGLNRRIRTVDALGGVSAAEHDAAGNLARSVDQNGHATTFTHDALDRLVARTDAEGHTTRFLHDAAGNRIAVIDGNGDVDGFEYDAVNQVTRSVNGEGEEKRYAYSPAGKLVRRTDPDGVVTAYAHDGLDRLAAVTLNERPGRPADAQTNVTYHYLHDAAGNLAQVVDPRGGTRTYEYDGRNLRVREEDQLGNAWTYAYDAAGNRVRRTDAMGRVTTYRYLRDDQLERVTYGNGGEVRHAYDGRHNRVSVADRLGTSRWTYDALNRPVSVLDALGRRLQYRYDPAGNRTHLVYPEGGEVRISYLANNWIHTVTDTAGYTSRYERDGVGQAIRTFNPNHTWSEAQHDRARRLVSITHRTDEGEVIAAFGYALDLAGLRSTQVATYGWRQPSTVVEHYTYDSLRRLIGVQSSEGMEAAFAYDASGNRTAWHANDDVTTRTPFDGFSLAYEHDAADRLIEAGDRRYVYDANGNRTLATWPGPQGPVLQGVETDFDFEDRPVAARAFHESGGRRIYGERTTWEYDGMGRRLVKAFSPGSSPGGLDRTEYVFDRNDPVAAYTVHDRQRDELYRGAGGTLVSRRHFRAGGQGQHSWYHHDGRGGVAALTKHLGQSTHTYRYDAFGQLIAELGSFTEPHNAFTFGEREWDANLGLYEMGNRAYDPSVGEFTTTDPLRGEIDRPRSLQRYAYAFSSPISHSDHDGLSADGPEATSEGGTLCTGLPSLEELMGQYGVTLSYDPNMGWTFADRANIVMGVRATGNALADVLNSDDPQASFQALFGNLSIHLDNYAYYYDGDPYYCHREPDIGAVGGAEGAQGFRCGSNAVGDVDPYLIVHELGHVLNALVANAISDAEAAGATGLLSPYEMLSAAGGISSGVGSLTQAQALNASLGFVDNGNSSPYSQSSYVGDGGGEVFADMFLNWVFSSFADDEAGEIRDSWMEDNMSTWVDYAGGIDVPAPAPEGPIANQVAPWSPNEGLGAISE